MAKDKELYLDEYYIVIDDVKKDVQVCMYVFDEDHPRGYERKVFSRNFGKDSAFSFEDAKHFCDKLCDIFNSPSFKRESISYGKTENN